MSGDSHRGTGCRAGVFWQASEGRGHDTARTQGHLRTEPAWVGAWPDQSGALVGTRSERACPLLPRLWQQNLPAYRPPPHSPPPHPQVEAAWRAVPVKELALCAAPADCLVG